MIHNSRCETQIWYSVANKNERYWIICYYLFANNEDFSLQTLTFKINCYTIQRIKPPDEKGKELELYTKKTQRTVIYLLDRGRCTHGPVVLGPIYGHYYPLPPSVMWCYPSWLNSSHSIPSNMSSTPVQQN